MSNSKKKEAFSMMHRYILSNGKVSIDINESNYRFIIIVNPSKQYIKLKGGIF